MAFAGQHSHCTKREDYMVRRAENENRESKLWNTSRDSRKTRSWTTILGWLIFVLGTVVLGTHYSNLSVAWWVNRINNYAPTSLLAAQERPTMSDLKTISEFLDGTELIGATWYCQLASALQSGVWVRERMWSWGLGLLPESTFIFLTS